LSSPIFALFIWIIVTSKSKNYSTFSTVINGDLYRGDDSKWPFGPSTSKAVKTTH
jgi:hypothetical protein